APSPRARARGERSDFRARRPSLQRRLAPGIPFQSRGCACPLQSTHFATAIPATKHAPTTSHGFGPPPRDGGLRRGRVVTWGPLGARERSAGGCSPCRRALIRLGFSLRRKSASSASGSASFAFTPPSDAERR